MARCIPSESPSMKDQSNVLNVKYIYISEAEGVSSLSLLPQIQRIMAWSLQWSCRSSGSFGPHVSLLWSIAEWTQATYTLPCIMGERCLEVRTGKNFLNTHLQFLVIAVFDHKWTGILLSRHLLSAQTYNILFFMKWPTLAAWICSCVPHTRYIVKFLI